MTNIVRWGSYGCGFISPSVTFNRRGLFIYPWLAFYNERSALCCSTFSVSFCNCLRSSCRPLTSFKFVLRSISCVVRFHSLNRLDHLCNSWQEVDPRGGHGVRRGGSLFEFRSSLQSHYQLLVLHLGNLCVARMTWSDRRQSATCRVRFLPPSFTSLFCVVN